MRGISLVIILIKYRVIFLDDILYRIYIYVDLNDKKFHERGMLNIFDNFSRVQLEANNTYERIKYIRL